MFWASDFLCIQNSLLKDFRFNLLEISHKLVCPKRTSVRESFFMKVSCQKEKKNECRVFLFSSVSKSSYSFRFAFHCRELGFCANLYSSSEVIPRNSFELLLMQLIFTLKFIQTADCKINNGVSHEYVVWILCQKLAC